MGDRTTRLLSIVALSLAVLALVLSIFAWRRADQRDDEVRRIQESLERAAPLRPGAGIGPPSQLDPGED
ncbi:MAG: hypothetical protein OHK0013_21520 [Sandaracinaceae bacterium]